MLVERETDCREILASNFLVVVYFDTGRDRGAVEGDGGSSIITPFTIKLQFPFRQILLIHLTPSPLPSLYLICYEFLCGWDGGMSTGGIGISIIKRWN